VGSGSLPTFWLLNFGTMTRIENEDRVLILDPGVGTKCEQSADYLAASCLTIQKSGDLVFRHRKVVGEIGLKAQCLVHCYLQRSNLLVGVDTNDQSLKQATFIANNLPCEVWFTG
jgi:hypothetical protein